MRLSITGAMITPEAIGSAIIDLQFITDNNEIINIEEIKNNIKHIVCEELEFEEENFETIKSKDNLIKILFHSGLNSEKLHEIVEYFRDNKVMY